MEIVGEVRKCRKKVETLLKYARISQNFPFFEAGGGLAWGLGLGLDGGAGWGWGDGGDSWLVGRV